MYKSKAKTCRRFTWSSERVFWASATFSLVSEVTTWIVSFSKRVLLAISEVDGIAEALTTWDSLKDTDWDRESLSLADSENEIDSLMDWLADAESAIDVVPKTKLSCPATPVAGLISDSRATFISFSSAKTGSAIVVAPARAPNTRIPLEIGAGTGSADVSKGLTISSVASVRETRKSPSCEMDARTQVFPDLINLKRVIRSVSRNSPFERLKNMPAP